MIIVSPHHCKRSAKFKILDFMESGEIIILDLHKTINTVNSPIVNTINNRRMAMVQKGKLKRQT